MFVSATGVVWACHTQAHVSVCLFVSTSSVALVLCWLTVHLLTLIFWQMMSLFSLHQWNSWEGIPPLEGRRSPKMVVHGPNINFGNQIWNAELASRLCVRTTLSILSILKPTTRTVLDTGVQHWLQCFATAHTHTHTHTAVCTSIRDVCTNFYRCNFSIYSFWAANWMSDC